MSGVDRNQPADDIVCCPFCLSTDPNKVGVEQATGKVCRDPFHCPIPDSHSVNGGPFRYCQYCDWREEPSKEPPAGTAVGWADGIGMPTIEADVQAMIDQFDLPQSAGDRLLAHIRTYALGIIADGIPAVRHCPGCGEMYDGGWHPKCQPTRVVDASLPEPEDGAVPLPCSQCGADECDCAAQALTALREKLRAAALVPTNPDPDAQV